MVECLLPKDAKQIVKSLRDNEDLNERALMSMIKIFVFYSIPFLFVYFFLVVHGVFFGQLFLAIIGGIILVLAAPFLMKRIWRTYFEAYVPDVLQNGVIKKIRYGLNGDATIFVENSETNSYDRLCLTFIGSRTRLQKDHHIQYYSASTGLCALKDKEYMMGFCIRKSMI